MTDKEFHSILQNYLQGKSTPEEERIVEAFFRKNVEKEAFQDYSPQEEQEARNYIKSQVWKHLKPEAAPTRKKPAINVFRFAALAAILMALSLWVYITWFSPTEIQQITKTTGRGQRTTVTLSDGSKVQLNAESEVTYPERFTDQRTRVIALTGEAFFEVKENPGKPFIVKTGNLNTTVLGTSFNVRAYPEDENIAVTVATGKVLVAPSPHPETTAKGTPLSTGVKLEKNQQARFHKTRASITLSEVSLEEHLAWKDGIIRFDDIPLAEAMSLLERWFNVSIQLERPDLGSCYIDGSYEGESLVNILESMKFVNGVAYEFQGNDKILITGNTCKN